MLRQIFSLVAISCALAGVAQAQELSEDAFTGQVNSSRVRLRVGPSLESSIVRELDKGEMLVVVGTDDDYYAVAAPEDISGYIFRTFVLDGVIEGTHVNVRLGPDTDSPVVTQLNTGDRVEGAVSEDNAKWLKIPVPSHARLFVARDYIDKIGPATLMVELKAKKEGAERRMMEAMLAGRMELRKPFEQIDQSRLTSGFDSLIKESELPAELRSAAAEARSLCEDIYLQKKIAFLESKTKLLNGESWDTHAVNLEEELAAFASNMDRVAEVLPRLLRAELSAELTSMPTPSTELSVKEELPQLTITQELNTLSTPTQLSVTQVQNTWAPVELSIFDRWSRMHPSESLNDMYAVEQLSAERLTGILQPYTGPSKNKPGDFVLVSAASKLPMAYLYSTQVDLSQDVGRLVTVTGAERPNHNFAFPAYHVMSVE